MARPRGRGARLSRRWIGFSTGSSLFTQAAGTAGVLLATATTLRDTVMRTRGNLCCTLDGVATEGSSALISLGLIIVPEGTGTTVLQSPFTDANADWFWYTQFAIMYDEPITDVLQAFGGSGYREAIDSKAMRISNPDTEVQLVMENTTVNVAVTVNVQVAGRFLLGQ